MSSRKAAMILAMLIPDSPNPAAGRDELPRQRQDSRRSRSSPRSLHLRHVTVLTAVTAEEQPVGEHAQEPVRFAPRRTRSVPFGW